MSHPRHHRRLWNTRYRADPSCQKSRNRCHRHGSSCCPRSDPRGGGCDRESQEKRLKIPIPESCWCWGRVQVAPLSSDMNVSSGYQRYPHPLYRLRITRDGGRLYADRVRESCHHHTLTQTDATVRICGTQRVPERKRTNRVKR